MARKKQTPVDKPLSANASDSKENVLVDAAAELAEFAARSLAAAEAMGIKTEPIQHFWLAPAQRDVLLTIPGISKMLAAKLADQDAVFSIWDVASLILAIAGFLPDTVDHQQRALLIVSEHLTERLLHGIDGPPTPPARKKRKPKADPNTIFQFRISLLDIKPAIWRRIQVTDCNLTRLHDYIQAAFGWENYHLHEFEIDGEHYSQLSPDAVDPDLKFLDEVDVYLSRRLPKPGKRTRWLYEYDFGDSWKHEVLFEGFPPIDRKVKYPLCLEGARACPPEDCGGTEGYTYFTKVLANPKHEHHQEWRDLMGRFDPEAFDVKKSTREMRKVK